MKERIMVDLKGSKAVEKYSTKVSCPNLQAGMPGETTEGTKEVDSESLPDNSFKDHHYRYFAINKSHSSSNDNVQISSFYERLASETFSQLGQSKIKVALAWPNGLEWPGLLHAIVTRASSKKNQGKGIRTVIYPAIHSNLSLFRKVHYHGDDILNEARDAALIDRSSLHPKYQIYFTLNALKNEQVGAEEEYNPPLSDVLPIFQYCVDEKRWKLREEHYFRETHKALWSSGNANRRSQIETNKQVMDSPLSSTDALFRVGKEVEPNTLNSLLLGEKGIPGGVDLVILDARYVMFRNNPAWRNGLLDLLKKIKSSGPDFTVVVATDSLPVHSQLRFSLRRDLKTSTKTGMVEFTPTFRVERGPWKKACCVSTKCESKGDRSNFEVLTTGQDIITITSKLYEVSRKLEKDGQKNLSIEFKRLATFIRNVANAPVGQKHIHRWLDSVGESWSTDALARASQNLLWTSRRLKSLSLLKEYGCETRHDTKIALDMCDRAMENYYDRTHVMDTLLMVTESHLLNERRGSLIVIVPHHIYINFIEDVIRDHFGETVLASIRIHHKEEFGRLHFSRNDRIVIAGSSETLLGQYITSNSLPDSVSLIFNTRGAVLCKRDLQEILRINGFNHLHIRANSILAQLNEQLRGLQLSEPTDPWSSGSLSPPLMIHGVAEPGEPAAVLHLLGYGELPVGKNSQILVHHTAHTRVFHSKTLNNLEESDQVLVFTESLKKRMETYLESKGEKNWIGKY